MASTTVEVKEGCRGTTWSKCLTRELVEQTATRVAETIQDIVDVLMKETSHDVSIKRKSTDTKITW